MLRFINKENSQVDKTGCLDKISKSPQGKEICEAKETKILNDCMETLIIPKRVYEKYNTETCFQINFTKEGIERLKAKYRQVRGLPAFIHNLMRGRVTPERDLFLEKGNLFAWSTDRSMLTIPNLCVNLNRLKDNPHILKDGPTEGLALVAWAIDPRLLKKYGWEQDKKQDNIASFQDFLHKNDNTKNLPSNYRHFTRNLSAIAMD